MIYAGCHLSATAGCEAMVRTALDIGANTFAFFTRNPRGSRAKKEDSGDAARAMALLEENRFGPLVAHGAYTMNLCTAEPEARAFAAEVLQDDLRRMAALPGQYYNFHPGSHVGRGTEAGIEDIAAADCLACTVAAIAITVGNDIGAFGWLSIRLDGSIERTIVAEIEIDKTVHPCGGIGYICVYEKTGEERIF